MDKTPIDTPAMNRPTMSMAICTAPVWIAHPTSQPEPILITCGKLTDDGNQSTELNGPLSSKSISSLSGKKSSDCKKSVIFPCFPVNRVVDIQKAPPAKTETTAPVTLGPGFLKYEWNSV
jgi:hypothetical protein